MRIRVINQHLDRQCVEGGVRVYIGRPSILGNPFVIGRDGDRAKVIAKFRTYAGGHLKVHHSWPGQTAPLPRQCERARVTFRSRSRCLEAATPRHEVRGLTSAHCSNSVASIDCSIADGRVAGIFATSNNRQVS